MSLPKGNPGEVREIWEYYRVNKEGIETHITISFDEVDLSKPGVLRRRAIATWGEHSWAITTKR